MKETTKVQFKKKRANRGAAEKRPCLIMIEGDYLGEIYTLEKGSLIIGRDDDADIIVPDNGVSRRHAMLEKRENEFVVVDLKSTNGTEVNGLPITTAVLKDNDKIAFSSTVLKFCYQDDIDTEYHRQLRNLAIKDGLTRIHNKRYFTDALEKEFSYARRHNVALSVIMFDIDHFKLLNDTYGHPTGDYVLRRLALLLEKGIRGYDVFARYGGEEFIFLLRGLSAQAAEPFAERIRKLVAEGNFSHNNLQLHVTISVGVATLDHQHVFESSEALLESADKFLYQAKQNGRNRVISALQTPASLASE